MLANKHYSLLDLATHQLYENDLREIVRVYALVQKATINGLPGVAV
jgi:hypothetical protein